MPSIYSRPSFPSTFLQALWRLVRMLFGGGRRVDNAESGNGVPVKACTAPDVVAKAQVATYRPDTTGVPVFVLSSMVGAAFAPEGPGQVKTVLFPGAPMIPTIVVTPPPADDVRNVLQLPGDQQVQPEKSDDAEAQFDRLPLRAITNGPTRVHGKTPPKRRVFEKENIGREKTLQLEQARAWSDAIKVRRRSLPIPPPPPPASTQLARRALAPGCLPLQERLRLAVAGCAALAPAVLPVAPLWGDDNVSFILDDDEEEEEDVNVVCEDPLPYLPNTDLSLLQSQSSPPPSPSTLLTSLTASSSFSSSGSISSILDAFEGDFKGLTWLGLRQLADLDDNESRTVQRVELGDGAREEEHGDDACGGITDDEGTTATTGQTSSHSRTTSKGRHLLPASSYITVKNIGTATRIGQPRDYPSAPPLLSPLLSDPRLGFIATGHPLPPDAWTGHPRPGTPPFVARGLDTRAARNSVKFGKWLSIRTPARPALPSPPPFAFSRALG
ncbi:hypothetical protein B0H13DRAFT_2689575 [Mycena leptocephala]|nr:hypothetical protein B0H13DRAFT_2689575 [Mycena leptocephala]